MLSGRLKIPRNNVSPIVCILSSDTVSLIASVMRSAWVLSPRWFSRSTAALSMAMGLATFGGKVTAVLRVPGSNIEACPPQTHMKTLLINEKKLKKCSKQ